MSIDATNVMTGFEQTGAYRPVHSWACPGKKIAICLDKDHQWCAFIDLLGNRCSKIPSERIKGIPVRALDEKLLPAFFKNSYVITSRGPNGIFYLNIFQGVQYFFTTMGIIYFLF